MLPAKKNEKSQQYKQVMCVVGVWYAHVNINAYTEDVNFVK